MDRVEFILRIIIRLKDEASKKLAAIKAEVATLGNNARNAQAKLDGLNSSVTSMTRRLTGLQNRLSSVRDVVRQIGDDESFEGISSAVDLAGNAVDDLADSRSRAFETAKRESIELIDIERRTQELIDSGLDKQAAKRLANHQKLAQLEEIQSGKQERREAPKPEPEKKRVDRTLNLDLVDFRDAVNKEGKKIIEVFNKLTGDLIGSRRSQKSAQNAALKWLRKQAEVTEADVDATKAETVAKNVVAKSRKKVTKANEDSAKTTESTTREAKKIAPSIQRELVSRDKLTDQHIKLIDALEAEGQEIIRTKLDLDDLRKVLTIKSQTPTHDTLTRVRGDTGEILRQDVFLRKIDEALKRPPISGGAPGGRPPSRSDVHKEIATRILSEADPDLISEFQRTEAALKNAKDKAFEAFRKHRHEFLNFFTTLPAALKDSGISEDDAKRLRTSLEHVPRNTKEALEQLYKLEREGRPNQALVDLLGILGSTNEEVDALTDKINVLRKRVNVLAAPLKRQIVEEQRAADTRIREEIDRNRSIGGSAPGGKGKKPPKEPPTPPPTAFDDDQEREFERHQARVEKVNAAFERLTHSLQFLRQEFREGSVDEHQFFFQAEQIRKELEKLAKSAPVDFAERIGLKVFRAANDAKEELDRLRALDKSNENLSDLDNALATIGRTVGTLTEKFELGRGALQIYRREADDLRRLSLRELGDEVKRTSQQLAELEAQARSREKSGRPTATIERTIRALTSRLTTEREILRQEIERVLTVDVDTTSAADIEHAVAASGGGKKPPTTPPPTAQDDSFKEDGDEAETAAAKFERFKDTLAALRAELADVHDKNVLARDFKDLAAELDKLSKKETIGSTFRRDIIAVAQEAKALEQQIIENEKRIAAERKEISDRVTKAQADSDKALTKEAKKEADQRLADAKKSQADYEAGVQKALNKQEADRKAAAAQRLRDLANERKEQEKLGETILFIARTEERLRRTIAASDAGEISNRERFVRFRALATALNKISDGFRDDEKAATEFGLKAHDAGTRAQDALQKTKLETEETGNVFDRLANKINLTGHNVNGLGDNVASIDNRLRGFAVLAIFVFAQQLISALTGVVGELGAVASSAVFAGAAIGGSLVTGISQALPMLGLFVAALGQVKAVTDAINKTQLVQQQGFQRDIKSGDQAAQSADQLANAQEGLADAERGGTKAHERLTEAQRNLDRVRKDARRNLQDLIQSERDAELAAKGAVLSQEEAHERLAAALLGGSNIDLRRARLGVQEADQGVVTSRQRVRTIHEQIDEARPIEQTESVRSAKRAVADAREGIEDANRAVQRAERTIEQTRRTAGKLQDETFAAQAQLQFMLSQLSPAQIRLFAALLKIKSTYQSTFVPITDILVDSFARGVDSADKVLQNPRFLRTARNLAGEMADALDEIRLSVLDPETFNRILGVIDEAAANIEPVTDIIIGFGQIWLNIAEASEPAFDKLLGWLGDLVDDIQKLTGDRDKLENFFSIAADHVISWLDLAEAIVLLFAALAGAGGAETGKKAIDELTESIQSATEWIHENRTEVKQFFEDSHRVVVEIAKVIFALGQAIVQAFRPESVEQLGEFLRESVIPALALVVRGVGSIITLILFLINNVPFLNTFAKWGIALTIFATVLTSAAGAMGFLALTLGHMFKILGGGFGLLAGFRGALAGILEVAAKLAGRAGLGALVAGLTGLATKLRGSGPRGSLLQTVADIADGPSATLPDGRRVKAVPRKGILGKLGLGKLVTEEADDVVRAADDVAGKGAARFGTGFLSTAKGLLKSSAWIAVGIGSVEGILTGFKTGNIGLGITDFFHSITFGIMASSEEIARKAMDEKILPVLKEGAGKFNKELLKPPPEGRQDTRGPAAAAIGQNRFAGIGGAPVRTALEEAFSKLPKDIQEAIKRYDELQVAFRKARRENDIAGVRKVASDVQHLLDKFPSLRDQFPKLAQEIEGFQDRAITAIDKIALHLKPQAISFDLSFELVRHPKQWKQTVDDAIAEMAKLPPGLRRKTKDSIDAMVDQLVKQGDLPPAKARKIKEKVVAEFVDMKEKSSKQAARTARNVAANLAAAQSAVTAQLALMGVNVNSILKAFGVGEVKNISLKNLSHNAGAIAGLATKLFTGDGSARGGVIGKAAGGMLGLPGERGKDLIPTWLGRGEMVLNHFHQRYLKPAVQAYYGHSLEDTFKRLRGEHAGPSGFTGFARGGTAGEFTPLDGHPGNIAGALLQLIRLLKRRFPESVVTSTTDHSRLTTSGNVSDHSSGHAVDISGSQSLMAQMTRYILSTGIWKSLKQGIHNPGLSINQGQKVATSYWGPSTWAQHASHLHLAVAGALGRVFAAVSSRVKRQVFGFPVEGPIKKLGQAVLDRARRAAQRKVDRATSTDVAKHEGRIPEGGSQRRIIRQAARIAGIPAKFLWGVYGAETNFGRNRNTSSAGAQGPFQFLPSTADSYVPGGRANIHNFAAAAVGAARYLKYLFGIFKSWPSAIGHYNSGPGGSLTNSETAAYIPKVLSLANTFRKGGVVQFAEGGIVPGGKGVPINVTAHGDEIILNPGQQSRVAKWLGTNINTLRGMLGFYGGPTSFAGGGTPAPQDVNAAFTTGAEKDRLRKIIEGIFSLPAIPVRAWVDLVREANRALRAIDELGKSYKKRIADINRELRSLRSGGVNEGERDDVNRLRDERSRLESLRKAGKQDPKIGQRFLKSVNEITKENGLLDQMDDARTRLTTKMGTVLTKMAFKIEKVGRGFRVVKLDNAIDVADKAVEQAKRTLEEIAGEKGVINDTLAAVNKRLKKLRRGGVKPNEAAEVQELVQAQNNLKDRLIEIASDQAEAIQAIYEAEAAKQQAVVDEINKRADQRNFGIGLAQRLGQLFGDRGVLRQASDAQIRSVSIQAQELAQQIAPARAIGNEELAVSLEQSFADLQVQIVELVNAQMRDAIDQVNNAASRRLGRIDLFSRMADAVGAVGLGGVATVAGETLSRGALFQQRGSALESQRSQLQDILNQTQANPLTAGNVQLIQDLTDQLAELDVTIAENTRAAFEARVSDVNDRTDFQNNLVGLRIRIAELAGTIAGTDSSAEVRGLLEERAGILEAQNTSLNALLTEAQASGDQQAINDLTTQLLDNEVATLENTLAIQQLVGADGLQDFATSAWAQFRRAIFDGAGGLLSQFAVHVPSAQMGAHIDQGGLIRVHSGEDIMPAKTGDLVSSGGDTIFNTDVNVTNPTEVADPVYLGNATAWRIANNPNLRP